MTHRPHRGTNNKEPLLTTLGRLVTSRLSMSGANYGAGSGIGSEIAAAPIVKQRKNLNEAERRAVISELLMGSDAGTLAKGDLTRVAQMFGTNRHSIAKLWKEYTKQKGAGVVDPDLSSRRKGNSGHKGINLVHFREALERIPEKQRTSQRALAEALGMPRSTLSNNLKKLGLRFPARGRKLSSAPVPAVPKATATTTAELLPPAPAPAPPCPSTIGRLTGGNSSVGRTMPSNINIVRQGVSYVQGPQGQLRRVNP